MKNRQEPEPGERQIMDIVYEMKEASALQVHRAPAFATHLLERPGPAPRPSSRKAISSIGRTGPATSTSARLAEGQGAAKRAHATSNDLLRRLDRRRRGRPVRHLRRQPFRRRLSPADRAYREGPQGRTLDMTGFARGGNVRLDRRVLPEDHGRPGPGPARGGRGQEPPGRVPGFYSPPPSPDSSSSRSSRSFRFDGGRRFCRSRGRSGRPRRPARRGGCGRRRHRRGLYAAGALATPPERLRDGATGPIAVASIRPLATERTVAVELS